MLSCSSRFIVGSKCAQQSLRNRHSISQAHRSYSNRPSLKEDFGAVPNQIGKPQRPVISSHTLGNGLQVVTIGTNDPIASVGLFVGTGSRMEDAHNAGASYFLRQMGFKSTKTRHALRLIRELELMSANYSVDVGREHILYSAELPCQHASEFIPILADVIHPELDEWEVTENKEVVLKEANHALADARTTLFETLHAEAFRNRGLGQGLYSTSYNWGRIKPDLLREFMRNTFSPDRMVLVAVGQVNHKEIVQAASSFESEKATTLQAQQTKYFGGDARLVANFDPLFALGYEGTSATHADSFSLSALKHILGSGSQRFDAPGVGLNARLNRNLVEKNTAIRELSAFNLNYSDSGIFGVHGVVAGGTIEPVLNAVSKELQEIASNVSEQEVAAAKAQLKSEVLFSTESRSGLLEFAGRQALLRQKSQDPEEYVKGINNVTVDSVKNSAKRMLSSRPTLVVVGDVSGVPTLESLKK